MILAIDTGNTHTVIGCIHANGEIVEIMRIESNLYKTEYEYAASIKLVLELNGVDLSEIEGAVISSVVPPLTVVLKRPSRSSPVSIPCPRSRCKDRTSDRDR